MLTREQLEMRRTGLGASEIGMVALVSPYGGPMDVWLAKRGETPADDDPEAANLKAAGSYHEDAVAQRYADRLGIDLAPAVSMRHPHRSWMLATPDRMHGAEPVEIKYITWPQPGEWEAEPPAHYVAQCAWQLEVCGAGGMDLVAEVQGDLRVFRVERDAELIEMLLDIGERFWRDHVLTGTPPPLDGSPACAAYLRKKYPDSNGVVIEADEAVAQAVASYRALGADERLVDKSRSLAYQQIVAAIGDNEGLKLRDGTLVSYRRNATAGVDWKALAAELLLLQPDHVAAELEARHTRRGSRVLRVHEAKPIDKLIERSSVGKALKRRSA